MDEQPGADSPAALVVARWSRYDAARALVRGDHEVIDSTAAVRTLIAEHILRGASEADRDLLNAFSVLGHIVATRGGSPTLAAAIVDGAIDALAPVPAGSPASPWVQPARGALAEAYVRARDEATRAQADARWEYPLCAVGLADGTVAIAGGYPDDDPESLAAWATRVAHQVARAGVRRVVLAGSPPARAALAIALDRMDIGHVAGRAI